MSRQILENNVASVEKEQQAYVFVPRVSIERANDKITLQVELPGVAKNDVDVNLEKNLLTITATGKNAEKQNQDEKREIIVREFTARNFKRVFELTEDVDADSIGADYNNGVLKLTLPLRKPISKKIALQ